MTREGDYFVPLEVRAKIANSASDSIFVSIHFNATDDDPNARGSKFFRLTPRGAPSTYDGFTAAELRNVQPGTSVDAHSLGALRVHLSFRSWSPPTNPDRGIKRARFAVLRLTKVSGGADRRRIFDRAAAKANDLEQRLAREICGRHWDRNRKLPGAAGQKAEANARRGLSA